MIVSHAGPVGLTPELDELISGTIASPIVNTRVPSGKAGT
jgi:hypothetical protein